MNQATKRGVRVECAVCGRTKKPRGRDGGMDNGRCDRDCVGYYEAPHVGSLWPGETDADFGYPCSDDGTEPICILSLDVFVGGAYRRTVYGRGWKHLLSEARYVRGLGPVSFGHVPKELR